MATVSITRRMLDLVKWLPYVSAGRYDLIDPVDRVEVACQYIEMKSDFEKEFGAFYRAFKEKEDEQVKEGLMFRHPQLGLISAEEMEILRRWAEDG